MHLQVVYCNHQTARLELRERLAFPTPGHLEQAYERLRVEFPKTEAVLLSTCNRIELYTAHPAAEDPPTHRDVASFFSGFHRIPLDEFYDDLQERSGADAVRHLFQVTSSIDSMVLGEPQIVNQVKEAYHCAAQFHACGPVTNALFQDAVRVSKKVRTETRLAEGRVSIASVAVGEFGKGIFDRFDDKLVLVIGAGEMAEETLRYLADEGVRQITVINRNPERAVKLAAQFRGTARPYEDLDELLGQADVVVSTTGADRPIVDAARFRQARRHGSGGPVFIIDLGAPRDFDPAVGAVDENVFLYDIDSLQQTCDANRRARSQEVERALGIIDIETDRFMQGLYHRATGPIVKRLREEWDAVCREELELLHRRLTHLADGDRQLIERSVERIVNKLLHPPLEALKDEAREGTPHGLMEAMKRLFRL